MLIYFILSRGNYSMIQLPELIEKCKKLAFDLHFSEAKAWKAKKPQRILVGYLPIYFPREIVHAAGAQSALPGKSIYMEETASLAGQGV